MRRYIGALVSIAVVLWMAVSAPAQDTSATIRTYQGVSYRIADPWLEVYYTIGEPKASKEETKFPSTISITTTATGTAAGGEQLGGGEQEARLLQGHSRASEITVSSRGVETRINLDQIQSMRFTRAPVSVAGLQLPSYIPHYRYSVSVSLMSGGKMEADYVNLGGTLVRGAGPDGRLDIPWEEIESIVFER